MDKYPIFQELFKKKWKKLKRLKVLKEREEDCNGYQED
jgi:hypothetical protein